jgi:hypothetical protein
VSAEEVGPTTRFGRLETRGLLLGLSGLQLAVVGAALLVAISAVYTIGMTGLALSSPVWGALLVAGTVSIGGRTLTGWVPLLAQWHVRRFTGTTTTPATTRATPSRGRLTFPGLPGSVELVDCPDLAATLIVDRREGTVTGVARLVGSGFVLDAPAEQEQKVAAWGRVLAGLCQQPAIVRAQVMARTRPGGLSPARAWWRQHSPTPDTPLVAALAQMLDEGFVVPYVRETFIALAVRAPRGRGAPSAADLALVARHLDAFASSATAAGLRINGWLDRDGLARVMRAGYDPAATGRAEEGPVSFDAAPGVRESWRSLATAGAVHATYWVSQWPRAEVHPAFLQPLLLGEAAARTVTMIAEPLPTGKALREIRRAKVEHASDAAQRARIGQVEDESTRAEIADLERREAELVAGHGDLRYTGLVTVSAQDEAELAQRCAGLETAAAQAMCEVRLLVGQQGVAHLAACLPLARGVL